MQVERAVAIAAVSALLLLTLVGNSNKEMLHNMNMASGDFRIIIMRGHSQMTSAERGGREGVTQILMQ